MVKQKSQDTKEDWRRGPRDRENPKRLAFLAAKYPPPDEFHFRAGPYRPPVYSVGTVLHDEYRGDLKVEATSDAPIPWPAASYKKGRRGAMLPILCGDLVRAVCEEDELTVAHYWGVSYYMVEAWKRAIAGAKNSNEVFTNLVVKRADPKFRKKFGYP
jgi:hypothetical protein